MIANLLGSAVDGHDLREALADIQAFLVASVLAAVGAGDATAQSADAAWARVERWPVPPPGPPR